MPTIMGVLIVSMLFIKMVNFLKKIKATFQLSGKFNCISQFSLMPGKVLLLTVKPTSCDIWSIKEKE
jgi:hypothetical protein